MRTIAIRVQTTQAAKEATTVENSEKIPTTVLKRLPIYLHFVKYMYPDNTKVYKDMLVYPQDYVLSALDRQFITELMISKRKFLG